MDASQIQALYDRPYAEAYNDKFLFAEITRSDTFHELRLLTEQLRPGMKWLDLACGTGYFLSHFPEIERAGVDLSPAMLELARQANPNVAFYQQSYLEPMPQWKSQWDFVSCMWYAYGLVNSIFEIEKLVNNMASWTSPHGKCFVPLSNPQLICQANLPLELQGPWPGKVRITGILWSYIEDEGEKEHAHQIAPQIEVMEGFFRKHFATVDIVQYPPAMPGWEGVRCALVASDKR